MQNNLLPFAPLAANTNSRPHNTTMGEGITGLDVIGV